MKDSLKDSSILSDATHGRHRSRFGLIRCVGAIVANIGHLGSVLCSFSLLALNYMSSYRFGVCALLAGNVSSVAVEDLETRLAITA